jgi:RimJ/RimL family protein N-acetyltransferase
MNAEADRLGGFARSGSALQLNIGVRRRELHGVVWGPMELIERPVADLAKYASWFNGPQATLLVHSVGAGNTRARLWVECGPQPASDAVLWDCGNKGFYVAGSPTAISSSSGVRSFLSREITEIARGAGLKYVSIRILSLQPGDGVTDILRSLPATRRTKLFHEYEALSPARSESAPQGVQLVSIDRKLIESGLGNAERVVAEVKWMWPSLEHFLSHGWGVAAVVDHQVVSWCTAEYLGPSRCGIGIETVQTHQRQGIATAVAHRFIEEARRRQCSPCWECDSENVASIQLAKGLGFRLTESSEWHVSGLQ